MSKKMHNLVVLIEPSRDAHQTPLKAGNMILNRFCIDEDAAFEISGVDYLIERQFIGYDIKGKEFLPMLSVFFLFYFILIN